MPRLVVCHVCHTMQRIPDVTKGTPMIPYVLEYVSGERYVIPDQETGKPKMVPAYDPILEDFVTKHEHGMPDEAVTHKQVIESWQVDQKTWDSMDVVTKIKDNLQKQYHQHYAETDEYRDSALKCYNAHGNPDITTGCRDYLDDSKRIGPATYKVEDGDTVTVPQKFRHYLCYVCPFQQTAITVELRRRTGMYDDAKIKSREARMLRRREQIRRRN